MIRIVIAALLFALSITTAPAFVVQHQQLACRLPHRQPNDHSTTSLQVAIDTSDIKNGLTVELNGEPHKVLSFSIMKQARGAAKTTIKFKNLLRGNTIENTYRSGEKFETALIEKFDAQYTYTEGVSTVFCLVEKFDGRRRDLGKFAMRKCCYCN